MIKQTNYSEGNNLNEFEDLPSYKKELLIQFCYKFDDIKSINRNHTSYSLKHLFENYHRDSFYKCNDDSYITNGQFKGAMLYCGFNVKNKEDLNWEFNISERSFKNIHREILKLNENRRNLAGS